MPSNFKTVMTVRELPRELFEMPALVARALTTDGWQSDPDCIYMIRARWWEKPVVYSTFDYKLKEKA